MSLAHALSRFHHRLSTLPRMAASIVATKWATDRQLSALK